VQQDATIVSWFYYKITLHVSDTFHTYNQEYNDCSWQPLEQHMLRSERCGIVRLKMSKSCGWSQYHGWVLTQPWWCLDLLCGAGGYPSNVLQPFETYCTNPALDSPFRLQRRFTSTGVRDLYQRKVELWARNVRSNLAIQLRLPQ
jgi:hypothetical protein